jgi:hypothetical protein
LMAGTAYPLANASSTSSFNDATAMLPPPKAHPQPASPNAARTLHVHLFYGACRAASA